MSEEPTPEQLRARALGEERQAARRAFLEATPVSKDYFTIAVLTGRTYSPVEDFVPHQDIDALFEALRAQTFPPEPLPWGQPWFRKSGKPTHMIKWLTSPDWRGWFMNEECKQTFDRFNLGAHRFYRFLTKKDDQFLPYYFLVVKPINDRFVDLAKSSFYTEYDDGLPFDRPYKEVLITSHEEYDARYPNGGLYGVEPRKLVLEPSCDASLDVIAFDRLQHDPFISTRLAKALKAMKPTGFEVVPTRILHASGN